MRQTAQSCTNSRCSRVLHFLDRVVSLNSCFPIIWGIQGNKMIPFQLGYLWKRDATRWMRRDFSCLPPLVQCCCVSDRHRLDWQVFVQLGFGWQLLDHNLVACVEEKWQFAFFSGFRGIIITATCKCLGGLLQSHAQVLMPLFERFASRAASSSTAG